MTDRIDKLRTFLKTSPEDAFLRHALGLEYVKTGADAEAKKIFISLLVDQPGYTGSYYHLGKLLERMGDNDAAAEWYRKGMEVCKISGDMHAYGELRGAFEELTF